MNKEKEKIWVQADNFRHRLDLFKHIGLSKPPPPKRVLNNDGKQEGKVILVKKQQTARNLLASTGVVN